jgi:hypothetical protein
MISSAVQSDARYIRSFFQNIPPALSAVLEKVNNDEELRNVKRTTFYTLMKEIGFSYEKRSKKALLIDRNDII